MAGPAIPIIAILSAIVKVGAKEAAKKYSTKTVKGFKPWDQFNQQAYEAFLAGVKWATENA